MSLSARPPHLLPLSLLTRRHFFLLSSAALGMLALPGGCSSSATPAPTFFTASERQTLAVLADFILPPDSAPGGSALGAVPFIERLLTAFEVTPPAIFAGGPYSGRHPLPGQPASDDFASFLPLDRVHKAAWRLRIYGSAGVPGGGPNDQALMPTIGLRDLLRQGLAAVLQMQPDPSQLTTNALDNLWPQLDQDFRDNLSQLVLEAALAAPEYGGNPQSGGWTLCHYEGDSQPLGYSTFNATTGQYQERPDAPVSTANPGSDPDPLDTSTSNILSLITLALGGRVL